MDSLNNPSSLADGAFTASAIGMAVAELDLTVVLANGALEELLGRPAAELTGRRLSDFAHAEDRAGAQRHDDAVLAARPAGFTAERRIARPDATSVWISLTASVLLTAQGRPRHLFLQAVDITAHKAAELGGGITERREEERRRDAEALAAQALREALEGSRLKSQFLANMSHEIRTPMNGVLGMIDALLHSPLTEEQQRHAETARRSAESLLTIIDDVLDFSKIEAGRLELEAEAIDLVELTGELRHLLWPRARARGLRLVVALDPAVPDVVLGDPVRLRQILINLITNAIKFSEDGEIVLTIEPESEDGVRFVVADQGIGIDEETLGRLFEPFTQADASTTRRFGGTGLGLAITRQLAELMGGTIEATSRPGVGSSFRFTARFPAVADADRPRPLGGVRGLVAYDEPNQLAAAVALVERWGGEASFATLDDAVRTLTLHAARGQAPAFAMLGDPAGGTRILPLLARLRERAGGPLPAVLVSDIAIGEPLPDGAVALVAPVPPARLRQAVVEVLGVEVLAHAPRQEAPVAPRPEVDAAIGEGRRVLVAEDNEVNQQVAMLTLRRRGFAVDVVGDGAEAVAASERVSYDLIFMDCHMPRMDGFAATAAIRERQDAAAAPIIAMTASSMPEDRERCRAAGMDDFVAKPVRPDDLDAVLRRWL